MHPCRTFDVVKLLEFHYLIINNFFFFARYLIENGANVAAVNNDGELAVDVAECDAMEDMLQQQIDDRGKAKIFIAYSEIDLYF